MPLRHVLYPGNVSWTEEGHQFSWHQKLRDKEAAIRFVAERTSTGERWELDSRSHLMGWQYSKMATRPDMILQLGHLLARELEAQGETGIEVHAEVLVSLNGRPFQPLIDPEVDLARQKRTIWGADWIEPLPES